MILSYQDIERIAEATMREFNQSFYSDEDELDYIHATPIDQFAADFLGLKVRYERLCMDESLCGITAYADTILEADMNGITVPMPIKQNEVILDIHLIQPGNIQRLCGKRRFSLAHECAHQILYQLGSNEQKASCRKMYTGKKGFTARELKTKEDWNEWQANVLGAAIMMPKKDIVSLVWHLNNGQKLDAICDTPTKQSEPVVRDIADFFHVSYRAALIRLERLDCFIDHEDEFLDIALGRAYA